jgi:hypothetical protein
MFPPARAVRPRSADQQGLSDQRLPVEHVIASIKVWRTLQRFTGRRDQLPQIIRAVIGLASDRAAAQGQWDDAVACQGLGEPVGVALGEDEVGVVQEPVD